jgi:hypothetical protein
MAKHGISVDLKDTAAANGLAGSASRAPFGFDPAVESARQDGGISNAKVMSSPHGLRPLARTEPIIGESRARPR